MFLSSRNNQFRFEFPRKFIPDHIANKYRAFVNRIPGGMVKEPIDLFNYGVQSINLPGPSFDPVSQTDFPGFTRNFRDAKPTQELFDKNLTVTMQSFDGFINYWMAVEIFQYYYSQSGKQPWIPDGVGIQLMDGEGNLFMTCQLQEMIMTGVGALDLNFSSNTVDFQTFDITFVYNVLEIKSIATEKVRAIPVSTSQPVVCLPAQILLNGDKVLDAQSGVRTDIRVLQGGQAVGAWNGQALIIPECEPADWSLEDVAGNILGGGQIVSGGSDIIVAPNADWSLVDENGGALGNGSILSGGSIVLTAPNADWSLEDTGGNPLSSGSILSGGSGIIVAPDGTVEINGQVVGAVESGGLGQFEVTQGGLQIGAWNGSEWVVPLPDIYTVLSDSVANVHYIGIALEGTPTSGQWEITRITTNLNTSITVETATGPWDDRYTLIYT